MKYLLFAACAFGLFVLVWGQSGEAKRETSCLNRLNDTTLKAYEVHCKGNATVAKVEADVYTPCGNGVILVTLFPTFHKDCSNSTCIFDIFDQRFTLPSLANFSVTIRYRCTNTQTTSPHLIISSLSNSSTELYSVPSTVQQQAATSGIRSIVLIIALSIVLSTLVILAVIATLAWTCRHRKSYPPTKTVSRLQEVRRHSRANQYRDMPSVRRTVTSVRGTVTSGVSTIAGTTLSHNLYWEIPPHGHTDHRTGSSYRAQSNTKTKSGKAENLSLPSRINLQPDLKEGQSEREVPFFTYPPESPYANVDVPSDDDDGDVSHEGSSGLVTVLPDDDTYWRLWFVSDEGTKEEQNIRALNSVTDLNDAAGALNILTNGSRQGQLKASASHYA